MKKIIALLSVFITAFFITTSASALSDYIIEYNGITEEYTGSLYRLMINGEFVDTTVPPLIFNDYALVPIREVCEPMGASVNYIEVSKQIFVNFNDKYLRFKIGENTASVDETDVVIPGAIAPMLISINGSSAKTMVPVRFMSENLGFNVDFDGENGIIKISKPTETEKSVINDYKISVTDENTTIKLTLDKPISSHTQPLLTSNNVLYFDIANCSYDLYSIYEINQGGIRALRFGIHDNSTRIALDLDNYTGYKVTLSPDKKIFTINITTGSAVNNEDVIPQEPIDNSQTAFEKIVVIDAGHGGRDPGTSGTLNYVTHDEKTLNLIIAKKVQKILEDSGIKVIMTREGDTYPTLTERSDIANINDAVMFVSIHANSATSTTASGFEVYYSTLNNHSTTGLTSKELAQSVIDELAQNISIRNRGVKTADHVVTKTSYMPAVLIEIGFMSNPEELALMLTEEFQNNFSSGVANGIMKVLYKAKIPSECGIIYEEMKAAEAAAAAAAEAEQLIQ